MKLQDLLSVLQGSPYIHIYFYPHDDLSTSENTIFRGTLTQLPYMRVKNFLNRDVKNVGHLDYLNIILSDY